MCDIDIADDAHEPERWAPQQTPRHCSCSFHLGDTKRPSQSAFLTLTQLAAWQISFASDSWYMRCITLRTGMALFTCPRYLHLTQPISSIPQRLLYPSSSVFPPCVHHIRYTDRQSFILQTFFARNTHRIDSSAISSSYSRPVSNLFLALIATVVQHEVHRI